MAAAQPSLVGETFDDVVTIATTHHLSDEQFVAMVQCPGLKPSSL